jgi:hypothetical protein
VGAVGVKRGTPEHPKTRRLARRLNLETWGAVGVLESLWHWAAKFARRGDIGRHDDADIAEGIGWRGDPATLIEALIAERWIDANDTYRLVIHDWHIHADDAVKKTLERAGETFATGENPRRDAVEPPSRRQGDKVSLARGRGKGKGKALAEASTASGFDRFWAAYPRRVKKPDALKAFGKLAPDVPLVDAMVAAIEAQKSWPQWQRDDGQFIPYPASWLNGRGWEDEAPETRPALLTPRGQTTAAAARAWLDRQQLEPTATAVPKLA